MAARQREWARRARERLLASLGRKCVDCGSTEDLELDCIVPLGHHHHGLDPARRVSFYRRQARAGNLTIRCSRHNSLKANLSLAEYESLRLASARDDADHLTTDSTLDSYSISIKPCEQC